MSDTWSLDRSDGEMFVLTDREGRAASLGHRLSIEATQWRADVTEQDGVPVSAALVVDVSSLQVRSGEGGVKSLSAAERAVARRQALRTLQAKSHPRIEFRATDVRVLEDGYELDGRLVIRGVTRPCRVVVQRRGDQLTCEAVVRQSDHGVKPVSFMMGALKVSDEVTVRWSARR